MLNERSKKNLAGVHQDLVLVAERASEQVTFIVTEGRRSIDRQKALVKAGKSWTLNSRHLTGHAIDVVDPDGKYDIPDMDHIASVFKSVAKDLNIPIVWGGDWKQRDTPHFELDKKAYPASGVSTATKAKEVVTKAVKSVPVVAGGGAAAGGTAVSTDSIPSPPDLTAVSAWKTFGQTLTEIGGWVTAHPVLAFGIAAWVGSILFWSQIKAAFTQWRAS